MLRQQPRAGLDVGIAARGMRRQLHAAARGSASPATPTGLAASGRLYSAIVRRM
jgi:hypothetical protein